MKKKNVKPLIKFDQWFQVVQLLGPRIFLIENCGEIMKEVFRMNQIVFKESYNELLKYMEETSAVSEEQSHFNLEENKKWIRGVQ